MSKFRRENSDLLLDNEGNPRGKLYAGFINSEESDGTIITIDDTDKGILNILTVGLSLTLAETNKSSNIISVEGNKITLDNPLLPNNKKVLIKGDIIILKDDNAYE